MSEFKFGGGFSGGSPDDNIRATNSGATAGLFGQGTQDDLTSGDARKTREGDLPGAPGPVGPGAREHSLAPSIREPQVAAGGSNVTGGVARRKRRVVGALAQARLGVPISKGYRTTDAIMFNNIEELFQDGISRVFAQEIIEELFMLWGITTESPEVAKYAEDLLWTFLIAATASNKADYDRELEVPLKVGTVTASFSVFSDLLAAKHGVTRRQFARAVADDLRKFIKHEENQFMIPLLATRIGCDPQYAHLAFDGSTHCSGMTSREIAFTKTLESRNLFEDDAVLASGASERLMQGPSGGSRSVVPR